MASRLERLEERTAARAPVEPVHRDEAEWLAAFEQAARDGYMDAEPDFPAALVEMRQALARAQSSVDPSFDPHVSFMPGTRIPTCGPRVGVATVPRTEGGDGLAVRDGRARRRG